MDLVAIGLVDAAFADRTLLWTYLFRAEPGTNIFDDVAVKQAQKKRYEIFCSLTENRLGAICQKMGWRFGAIERKTFLHMLGAKTRKEFPELF